MGAVQLVSALTFRTTTFTRTENALLRMKCGLLDAELTKSKVHFSALCRVVTVVHLTYLTLGVWHARIRN